MNNSYEYKMQCLARHYMRTATDTTHMSVLFAAYQKRNGKAAREALREYVLAEQEQQRASADYQRRKQFGEVA